MTIAAITVTVAAIAGGAVAGWPGVATVAIAAAALALVVLRGLIPRSAVQSIRFTQDKQEARTIRGYAQRRSVVASSVTDRSFYEADLRPVLEHLLAARLAERHGINLYQDPAAAMRAFCRDGGDQSLWSWIDPAQALTAQDRDMHTASRRAAVPSGLRSEGAERGSDEGRRRAKAARRRAGNQHGIPRRTLGRLINRLEQL